MERKNGRERRHRKVIELTEYKRNRKKGILEKRYNCSMIRIQRGMI